MQAEPQRPPCPPVWPCLLVCAALAAWIDFGSLHRSQHADSLLPALVSLYRWMPFYWELDRIGMLVPWIAQPIKHPLFNLLAQDGLYLFCALSALVLLPRYLLRNATFPFVGLASVAAFLGLTPVYYRFEYLIDTQYGVWLFLGLSSLILLEPGPNGSPSWARRIAAVVLMVLAHWVYCTATMFLGPLIVFRALCFVGWASPTKQPRDGGHGPPYVRRLANSELFNSLATLAIGFAAGLGLMRLAPTHDSDFASLPPGEWLQAWQNLAASTWSSLAPQWWTWVLIASAAAGLMGCCHPAIRQQFKANGRAALAATAAAVLIALFIGTRHWVVANGFAFRFLLPSALMLQAALLGIAAAPLSVLLGSQQQRLSYVVAMPLALVAAFASYGPPSLAGVYRDLDPHYAFAGTNSPQPLATRELLDSGATHVAGDYWKVWPAVFRANLALYERGERRTVWGIAQRSGPTHRYWSQTPRDRLRVAIAAGGDPAADSFFIFYQLAPLAIAEKRDTLWLLRPAEISTVEAQNTTLR